MPGLRTLPLDLERYAQIELRKVEAPPARRGETVLSRPRAAERSRHPVLQLRRGLEL
jgi:hypothetical protein